jgi:hypothetical protein
LKFRYGSTTPEDPTDVANTSQVVFMPDLVPLLTTLLDLVKIDTDSPSDALMLRGFMALLRARPHLTIQAFIFECSGYKGQDLYALQQELNYTLYTHTTTPCHK